MQIVGIEGVREFGHAGHRSMIVQLPDGEKFQVPIDSATYEMLNELGNLMELRSSTRPQNQSSDQAGQSLEEFAAGFVTGPNQSQAPSAMVAQQRDLVGQLASLSPSEAVEAAAEQGGPLEDLRKVGFFGEPTDVLKALGGRPETQGPDLVESFEDTSDDSDEDDPGEYVDSDLAEQL